MMQWVHMKQMNCIQNQSQHRCDPGAAITPAGSRGPTDSRSTLPARLYPVLAWLAPAHPRGVCLMPALREACGRSLHCLPARRPALSLLRLSPGRQAHPYSVSVSLHWPRGPRARTVSVLLATVLRGRLRPQHIALLISIC